MKAQGSVELVTIVGALAFILLIVGVIYVQYQHSSFLLSDAVNCEQSVRQVATVINKVSTIPNASYEISLTAQRCVYGVHDRYVYGKYNPTKDDHANIISEYILTNLTQDCEFNASGEFIIKNDDGVITIEEA